MHKPKKRLLQVRRKAARATRDMFYSPERDLAYIGPNLFHGAITSLESEYWEPWLAEFMATAGLTYSDLVAAGVAEKFAHVLVHVIKERTPKTALDIAGFSALPPAMQLVLYARLGQVALAAIWSAVKDVHKAEDTPPASMQDLLNDASDGFEEMLGNGSS